MKRLPPVSITMRRRPRSSVMTCNLDHQTAHADHAAVN
jgi:hypothetical protein